MNKSETRAYLKEKRESLLDRKDKNNKILEKLTECPEVVLASSIFCYLSTNLEAQTDQFILWCLQNRKTILVPKIIDGDIYPVEIDSLNNLEKNNFGIREPGALSNVFTNKIDVIVIPGLGFDKKKQRIGYGKGHYDKYFARENRMLGMTIKIGLCFSELVLEEIPTEEHDFGVDILISEDLIF